jgi:hypothetical protein
MTKNRQSRLKICKNASEASPLVCKTAEPRNFFRLFVEKYTIKDKKVDKSAAKDEFISRNKLKRKIFDRKKFLWYTISKDGRINK